MFGQKAVKLRGLNNKQIAVNASQVLFLEEADIDGKMVCNIHFSNGRWVTAGHGLTEVHALLGFGNEETEEQKESWRKVAEGKRLAALDAEAAIRQSDLCIDKYRKISHKVETDADGVKKIEIVLQPLEATDI